MKFCEIIKNKDLGNVVVGDRSRITISNIHLKGTAL